MTPPETARYEEMRKMSEARRLDRYGVNPVLGMEIEENGKWVKYEDVAETLSCMPADVIELVIAARIVAFEDQSPEALKRLDTASEAFADRVPWEKQI